MVNKISWDIFLILIFSPDFFLPALNKYVGILKNSELQLAINGSRVFTV